VIPREDGRSPESVEAAGVCPGGSLPMPRSGARMIHREGLWEYDPRPCFQVNPIAGQPSTWASDPPRADSRPVLTGRLPQARDPSPDRPGSPGPGCRGEFRILGSRPRRGSVSLDRPPVSNRRKVLVALCAIGGENPSITTTSAPRLPLNGLAR
jgi:hypothetical protein